MFKRINSIWNSYNVENKKTSSNATELDINYLLKRSSPTLDDVMKIKTYIANVKNRKNQSTRKVKGVKSLPRQTKRTTSPIFTQHNILQLDAFQDHIKGKRICLVANSSDLLKDKLGSFIDSHDIVVRFNSYAIDEVYTGKKTNIHASIYLSDFNLDQRVDYRLIISSNKDRWITVIRKKVDPSNQIAVINSNWPVALNPKLRGKRIIPTTGFNAIELFYEIGGYAELNLIGFNLYKTGASSIYRSATGSHIADVHDYEFERKWVNDNFKMHSKYVMTHVNSSI
jgi:hypothetical protein